MSEKMEIDPEKKVIEQFNIATGWGDRIADWNQITLGERKNNVEVWDKIDPKDIKKGVWKSVRDIFDK